MTEHHFRSHFLTFQIYTQYIFLKRFHKMAAVLQNNPRRPFWVTENHFRSHFSSLLKILFSTKWPQADILDDRKSLLIAFISISDQYATYFLEFCSQLPTAILDDRKSLSIAFLAISDQCVINGYAKYEVDRWIYDTVRDATSFLSYGQYEFDWCTCDKVKVCTNVGVRRRNQKHNVPEFSNFGDIIIVHFWTKTLHFSSNYFMTSFRYIN